MVHLHLPGAWRTLCNLWVDSVSSTLKPEQATCARCIDLLGVVDTRG